MAGARGSTAAMVGAVARRPGLWAVATRQALRLARPGWWHRPPFLPLPDRDYLAFRLETQYGGAPGAGVPSGAAPGDLVRYLEWCRDQDRAIKHGPGRARQ